MATRIVWDEARIRAITTTIPIRAHQDASLQAASLAAARVGGSGRLASDVGRPKSAGLMTSFVGSNAVYARIQDTGGTIHAKKGRLLIGANRGDITASAEAVRIPGKHYLEAAVEGFPDLYISALRRLMPA